MLVLGRVFAPLSGRISALFLGGPVTAWCGPRLNPLEDDGPKSCGTRRNSKSTGTRTGGGSLLMYQLPLDPPKNQWKK